MDASLRDRQPWKAAHERDYAWLGDVITKHYHGDDTDVGYLEANGFTSFIASGGDRDFMRPVTEEIYGIPAERVIGSSNALSYQEDEHGGTLVYLEKPDVFDDGPTKPVRIWSRIGRRPILAGGNSNGDIPMLHYSRGPTGQGLRLLVLRDDPEREFDYTAGSEQALERAKTDGWSVVSIKNDWAAVFPEPQESPA